MWGLGQFGFAAVWSPLFMAFMMLVAVLYGLVAGPWRARFRDSEPVPVHKKAAFYSGLALLYLALGGPLDLLGHLTFTWHMVSMSVAYLLAPPLLLSGLPAWFVRPFFEDRWFAFFKRFLHPIFTVLFFNTLFSFYHMPVIHDYVMTHYTVHTLYYLLLFVAAMLMWWPVICPVPEMDTMTDLKKMGYIFLNGVLLTPACALIIFASGPLYNTFYDPVVWARALAYCVPGGSADILSQYSGPSAFATMDPRHDQQLGGVIMKLAQEFIYGTILFYVFNQWFRKESREDDPEPAGEEWLDNQLNRA